MSLASIGLYLAGALFVHDLGEYFLIWNLFLAWLPVVFVYLLLKLLQRKLWSSWPAIGLTFLWLMFLPNSFYLITDYLHILDAGAASALYNVAMFGMFAFSGMALGFFSLRLVHTELNLRGHPARFNWSAIMLILLIASYAIYLGRYIRLNSWDIFTNFSSVMFAVSDQILHPEIYSEIVGVTLGFFVLLGTIYVSLTWLNVRRHSN